MSKRVMVGDPILRPGNRHRGEHAEDDACDFNPKCTWVGETVKARRMRGKESWGVAHRGEHDELSGCVTGGLSDCIPADQLMPVQILPPKGPGDSTPSHYQGKGMTPFDVWDAFDLDRYEANAVKYLLRWRKKNGVEDLKKARHYVDILISRAEAE